jgi:uncharacterized protein
MPYVQGRVVHDADSHIMEPPEFYEPYLDPKLADRLLPLLRPAHKERDEEFFAAVMRKQRDPALRERDAGDIMLRKNFEAPGAFWRDDRSRALDHLGFASQLVFTTSLLGPLAQVELSEDLDITYGLARAHNRGMLEFCSADPRLLPVAYVPLAHIERTVAFAKEVIRHHPAALMISSACPRRHSPTHVGFDPMWAAAEDAGIPIVFHVGGGTPMDITYKENGLQPVKDFHGGDDNFTSVSFMAIPTAPMQTVATMIIDGILERFPRLKIGLIEQGASWVPGWMRSMDSAASAFSKNEERLHQLSLLPSEYVRRQVRVAPYPHEPTGWIIKQAGPEVCLFSSDFPHVEGGRHPLKRFASSTSECSAEELDAFYRTNFEDLMGASLRRLEAS